MREAHDHAAVLVGQVDCVGGSGRDQLVGEHQRAAGGVRKGRNLRQLSESLQAQLSASPSSAPRVCGKSSFSMSFRISCASCRSVFYLRTRRARISASSPSPVRSAPQIGRLLCVAGRKRPRRLASIRMRWNRKERVYHFVYHCDRELRLAGVSTIFGQKQNPLI